MFSLCVDKPTIQQTVRRRASQLPRPEPLKFSKHASQVDLSLRIKQAILCGTEATDGGLDTSVGENIPDSDRIIQPESADMISPNVSHFIGPWVEMRGMYSPIMIKGTGRDAKGNAANG